MEHHLNTVFFNVTFDYVRSVCSFAGFFGMIMFLVWKFVPS